MHTLDCRKDEFRLAAGQHYINCAYLSPISRRVEKAAVEALQRLRNPATITASDFFEPVDSVRRAFALLIGSDDPTRVAILPSVSYGMATIAHNLDVRSRGQIILVEDQFPSDVYIWRRLASAVNLNVRHIGRPYGASHVGAAWSQRVIEAVDGSTAAVCIPQVHWTDGTRFELEDISDACRRTETLLIVDGSQSIGAHSFDLKRVNPDALICAGYKWLTGPYGMSLGYFGDRLLDGVPIEENWIVRSGSEDFGGLVQYRDEYQPGAIRYDVGERSNFVLIPMMLEGIRQILEWQPEAVQRYCRALMEPAVSQISELGYTPVDRQSRSGHLLGIRLPRGLSPEFVQKELAARKVFVSVRSDAIRVAPNVYNDEDDMQALVEALRAVLLQS